MPPTVACFDGVAPHPPRVRPPLRRAERPRRHGARGRAAGADRAGRSDARHRERRPHPRRPARPSTTPRPRILRSLGHAAARHPGEPRHPAVLPGPLHAPVARVRAALGDHRARPLLARSCTSSALNSVRPFGYQRGRVRRGRPRAAPSRACARRRRERCASSPSTTSSRARRGGSRKLPLVVAEPRARSGSSTAGAELIVGGHTHQAAICERREFEVLDGDTRSCVLATAPGLGRPRAGPAATRCAACSSTAPTSARIYGRDARLAGRGLGGRCPARVPARRAAAR